MSLNAIKIKYSLFGGILLISDYFIGLKIFYISGLLIPVVYIVTIIMAFLKCKKNQILNFKQLFNVAFIIFVGMTLVNLVFLISKKSLHGSFQEGILAYSFIIFFGMMLSLILAFLFKQIFRKS